MTCGTGTGKRSEVPFSGFRYRYSTTLVAWIMDVARWSGTTNKHRTRKVENTQCRHPRDCGIIVQYYPHDADTPLTVLRFAKHCDTKR